MKQLYLNSTLLTTIILLLSGTLNAQSYVDDLLSHKITVHYPEHTVVAQVKPTGKVTASSQRTYHWFSGNQINSTQGGYSGKLLNGDYQDFYSNKNLKESGKIEAGLKTGQWRSWTENGILRDQYSYKKGLKEGDYFTNDTAGKVKEKGVYQAGLLNGKHESFVGDSTVTVYYTKGKTRPKANILPKFILKVLPGKNKQ